MHRSASLIAAVFVLAGPVVAPIRVAAQPPLSEFRSIDGSGNNLANPAWGKANEPLLRTLPNAYVDGLSQPRTEGMVSPRAISNVVFAQPTSMVNIEALSSMFWQWGQFVDHDISLTPNQKPPEPFDIAVPTGDPYFDPASTGFQHIFLQRSQHTGGGDVRQQINTITSYLDGSGVYGSDLARANELRELDGSGRLKTTSGDLMPFNVNQLPNDPDRFTTTYFLAGDKRANEQLDLIAMHTLFVREHNYRADSLRTAHPTWTGDEVYEMARAIVTAEIQVVTYRDFLPLLLGGGTLPSYGGYDLGVNAAVANEFSTVAFRFGHSMLPMELMRLDAAMQPIVQGHVALRDAFFVPSKVVNEGGIDPLLRGLILQAPQRLDSYVNDEVRNFLFGLPGSGGFDLVSLNIQRARDHGMPSYNNARRALGLAAKSGFAEVTSDPDLQAVLAGMFTSVEDLDFWVGGLVEDHASGAMVGELFQTVIADQFERLRDGDRFWYATYLPASLVTELEAQTLADIIRRNTGIGSEIPDDVFHLSSTVAVGDPFSRPAAGLSLSAAFPNPSVGRVSVDFTVPSDQQGRVSVTVHDAQGRQLRSILDGWVPAGAHRLQWDGRDARGQTVSPGVFFFRLRLGNESATRSFVVIGRR